MDSNVMVAATKAIKKTDGIGIPTVKPWNLDVIAGKMEMVHESKALAVAMDIDAAGLPFLKNMEPPAGSKTVEELRQIAKMAGTPFIVKGVMTVKGALKAKEAEASAIVVSNHGGRVLDQCPATAEVLEEIALAVGDSMKIFVDGGIRSGVDVFKALALGADAVIIARPFVTAVYGVNNIHNFCINPAALHNTLQPSPADQYLSEPKDRSLRVPHRGIQFRYADAFPFHPDARRVRRRRAG